MAVTQEQIDKWRELYQQYKAWEITQDQAKNQMADELYARDTNKLQNADVNVSRYGDDHTEQNYSNSEMWWWENQKYTGKNTKNSYTAYDPNATTEWLNPNYQYWRNAQMANSEQANYIANRNDQIASALYNEWKTSIEDVANFLRTQRGFDNSTENERQNTINSVWKRIGQMAQENWNKDTDSSNWPTDQNNDQALQNMQDDLMKDTSGKLYGKVTADETEYGNAINTVADPYSVDRAMAESRTANLRKLQTMDSQSIAASIISGTTPYGEQAMRDLMQYNPQKYEEIQTSIKQLKGQQTINSIASGEWEVVDLTSTAEWDITQFAQDNANDTTSVWQILQDVKSTLESNTAANSAQATMDTIEWDIKRLQKRLKNLKKEANQVFKWDVPQYIVNAYVANRTAEINDELSILEWRWNAANERYTREVSQANWEKEYQLKREEFEYKKQTEKFDQKYKNWQMNMWSIQKDANWNYVQINISEDWTLYFSKIENVSSYAWSGMKWAWLKNNNPWNIKDTTFGNVIWTSSNGFAMFATPEDGFDALVAKIQYNQTNPNSKYYGKTIAEYFQMYAPASDWNDPVAYANSVAKQLWVDVNTPISQLDATKFAAAIAKHDSWYDYSTYGQFRNNNWWWTSWWYNAEWEVLSDDWVTPISYRQRIYNLIPATLKNSDTELKNVYNTAKQLYQAWYTADEAAMTFYWLDPRNDTTWLLKPLLMKARASSKDLPETFYWNLWGLLASWETWQAVRLVENSILSEKDQIKEANAISLVGKINSIEKFMNQFEWKNWWIYEWTIKQFLDKYATGKEWSEYAQLAAQIQNAFGSVRNELLWSTVTENENAYYAWMLPSETDKRSVLRTKLTAAKNNALMDVNAARKQYWLSEITAAQLVNPNLRASLYATSDRE